MKKKQKKSKKSKRFKKKTSKNKLYKKTKKIQKNRKKKSLKKIKRFKKKSQSVPVNRKIFNSKIKKESLALKLVKLQLLLKPQFNFKINFSLEKHIQGFFDKISNTITEYKIIKAEKKRRQK